MENCLSRSHELFSHSPCSLVHPHILGANYMCHFFSPADKNGASVQVLAPWHFCSLCVLRKDPLCTEQVKATTQLIRRWKKAKEQSGDIVDIVKSHGIWGLDLWPDESVIAVHKIWKRRHKVGFIMIRLGEIINQNFCLVQFGAGMKSEIARAGMKHRGLITQHMNPFDLYIMVAPVLVLLRGLCVCVWGQFWVLAVKIILLRSLVRGVQVDFRIQIGVRWRGTGAKLWSWGFDWSLLFSVYPSWVVQPICRDVFTTIWIFIQATHQPPSCGLAWWKASWHYKLREKGFPFTQYTTIGLDQVLNALLLTIHLSDKLLFCVRRSSTRWNQAWWALQFCESSKSRLSGLLGLGKVAADLLMARFMWSANCSLITSSSRNTWIMLPRKHGI